MKRHRVDRKVPMIVLVGVLCWGHAVVRGQGLPYGDDPCLVRYMYNPGWSFPIAIYTSSNMVNPRVVVGWLRVADDDSLIDMTTAPLDMMINSHTRFVGNYTLVFRPPQGGWKQDVTYLFTFLTMSDQRWFQTQINFRFEGLGRIKIEHVRKKTGKVE